jgi:hypothetical protein
MDGIISSLLSFGAYPRLSDPMEFCTLGSLSGIYYKKEKVIQLLYRGIDVKEY